MVQPVLELAVPLGAQEAKAVSDPGCRLLGGGGRGGSLSRVRCQWAEQDAQAAVSDPCHGGSPSRGGKSVQLSRDEW